MTDEDRKTLDGLYQSTFKLGKSLGGVKENLVAGGKIVDVLTNSAENLYPLQKVLLTAA